jgi:osmotically-inducible protein OsmY
MSTRFSSLAVAFALMASPGLPIPLPAQEPKGKEPASDNTKANQRDRNRSEPTADQAKQNPSDLEIMRKIRRSIVQDKDLSTYAHNVKVIAQDGRVTLKGPVRSEQEKRTVEAKAVLVAGEGNVVNEITVAPGDTSK